VAVDQLGHLEHRDLAFLKIFLQLGVGVDHGPLGLVLEVVLLDVLPDLLGDLGAGQRLVADDRRRGKPLGVIAFMNAAFGVRFLAGAFAFFAAFFAGAFFAAPSWPEPPSSPPPSWPGPSSLSSSPLSSQLPC
jgi:hypothetical protein